MSKRRFSELSSAREFKIWSCKDFWQIRVEIINERTKDELDFVIMGSGRRVFRLTRRIFRPYRGRISTFATRKRRSLTCSSIWTTWIVVSCQLCRELASYEISFFFHTFFFLINVKKHQVLDFFNNYKHFCFSRYRKRTVKNWAIKKSRLNSQLIDWSNIQKLANLKSDFIPKKINKDW